LTQEQAEERLEEHGHNAVAEEEGHGRLALLGKALVNPLVILLSVLATVSLLTGDARAAVVMASMVVLGVSLRFVQEARADTAAKKLRAMIKVTATVVRDGTAREITKFILFIGPCSSLFDYTTYFVMMFVFKASDPAHASLFQTGWFVESLLTQTLVIHVIRTSRLPFIQTHASVPLTLTSLAIMAIGVWLPYSPFAAALGFTALPPLYWPLLVVTLVLYVLLTQAVKMWLLERAWI
jgi:magnesium-transporting ATPase (P-type)